MGLALLIGLLWMRGRLLDAAQTVRLAVWLHLGSHLLIAAPDLALLHAMYGQGDVVWGWFEQNKTRCYAPRGRS